MAHQFLKAPPETFAQICTLSVSMPFDMAQVETMKSMTLSLRPLGTW